MNEALRIFALLFLGASVWVPAIYWSRMSQTQRYLAVFALGAAFVFYQYHPTHTACEVHNTCDQSGY